jgi:hypothetical protein
MSALLAQSGHSLVASTNSAVLYFVHLMYAFVGKSDITATQRNVRL